MKETKIDIEAKLLSVIGQILAEYEDAMYTLMENVNLDREMISDLKEEKKAHMKQRVESEINWMAERWEEAQEDVQLRWRAFADSMTGMYMIANRSEGYPVSAPLDQNLTCQFIVEVKKDSVLRVDSVL